MDQKMQFSVSHAASSAFRDDGLRPFFQYRDLGMRAATGDRVLAHVIRAKPGVPAQPERHHHLVEFQMVYVLKGWIRFDYAGVGEVTLEAGSCVHQPPGILHTELGHSDDLELIEIVLPAGFATVTDP